MKRTFLITMLVLLSTLTNAALTVTDVSFDELYINEEPWIIGYCDSFTISTDTSATLESFYIGTRYPSGDMGGIYLYDIHQQFLDGYYFLDGQILQGVNPQIVILNDIVTDVQYVGNSGNEDMWLVNIDIGPGIPQEPINSLVQFNYVPEPATVMLLALGGVLIRKRRQFSEC